MRYITAKLNMGECDADKLIWKSVKYVDTVTEWRVVLGILRWVERARLAVTIAIEVVSTFCAEPMISSNHIELNCEQTA